MGTLEDLIDEVFIQFSFGTVLSFIAIIRITIHFI